MFTNFKVNLPATFTGIAFLSCDPKTAFGRPDVQEMTKGDQPTPKWEVQVVALSRDAFGKAANGVMKVTIASFKDPGAGIAPYTAIDLTNFEVGVMEKTKKNPETKEEKVIGVNVYYRAEAIVKVQTAAPAK